MPCAKPKPNEIQAHVLAVLESRFAPSRSPLATLPFTWAANTMDTIPRGRQQKMVTSMACAK